MMDQWEDQKVISAVLDGDVDAYSILVTRYQKPIYNLMYRMTRSCEDASDLAQETFIRAFERLHRFREGGKFLPWLYTIGLNHSRNFLCQRSAHKTSSLEDCDPGSGLDHPGQQEEIMCAQLDYQQLRAALCELPTDYREALILRYHEDVSLDEIAKALGVSLSGAKMRVHRGLKKLREILERSQEVIQE
jgi:RNA polymerase sigma-70 factor (ECF subfamily)